MLEPDPISTEATVQCGTTQKHQSLF